MPIKSYRPFTPSRRYMTTVSREEITRERPEKSLLEPKQRSGGRNSTGRVTSRFIGGGHKQAYRVIDFKRDKTGVSATVAAIEYDPNRSARIALLHYKRWREALYSAAGRSEGGHDGVLRADG